MMKFSEMPYTRPDPDEVKKELSELTGRLKNAGSSVSGPDMSEAGQAAVPRSTPQERISE